MNTEAVGQVATKKNDSANHLYIPVRQCSAVHLVHTIWADAVFKCRGRKCHAFLVCMQSRAADQQLVRVVSHESACCLSPLVEGVRLSLLNRLRTYAASAKLRRYVSITVSRDVPVGTLTDRAPGFACASQAAMISWPTQRQLHAK